MVLRESDVYQYFGETYASRGSSYQRNGRVLSVEVDLLKHALLGEVRGSNQFPYGVKVYLSVGFKSIKNAECKCPMGGFCKHAAALAFEVIRSGKLDQTGPGTLEVLISHAQNRLLPDKKESRQIPVSPQVLSDESSRWIGSLSSALAQQAPQANDSKNLDQVIYLLDPTADQRLVLNVAHAKKLKSGGWGKLQKCDLARIATQGAGYVTDEDSEIAKLFLGSTNESWHYRNTFPEVPEICLILLERILRTGRCYLKELTSPLSIGQAKKALLEWETRADGKQVLRLRSNTQSDVTVIAGVAWYINALELKLGPLELPASSKVVKAILGAPAIDPTEALSVSIALAKISPLIPAPKTDFSIKTVVVTPKPVLTMMMEEPKGYWSSPYYRKIGKALVSFDYGAAKFDYRQSESRCIEDNNIVIYKKEPLAEALFVKQIESFGLKHLEQAFDHRSQGVYGFRDGSDIDWLDFGAKQLPKLKELGWNIIIDKSFNLELVEAEEQWSLEATEGSDFWFSLDLGIIVNGKKVPLLPIIHEALRRIPGRAPLDGLEKLNHDGVFYAPLADGRHIALPFERVRIIVEALVELFDRHANLDVTNTSVSLPQVMALSKSIEHSLEAEDRWSIGSKIMGLLEKIKNFQGLEAIAPPKNFGTTLRPYQLDGLSWLNFLREFELGGVLADDMGLGKTVQTLAHISYEKKEKRLKKPFLVVCPTSVLPNWISEIDKFAPGLKTTALCGSDRAKDFNRIATSDIVATTYPLVCRDLETLLAQEWKAVILDEAQMIKNPSTQIAQAVAKLKSDYRVCLTGTPIENHLGELWSQFNFLMPGFLRDLPTFTKTFRTPIEKQKDKQAQKVLASRIRPFLLRRTKELVAKDLPEKSIIIKRVELEGAQRDLYETVRLAMYEKVKDALASMGLNKSQIVILDALLKLRQVCCDPRLVPLVSAQKVQATAKLDLLISMVEELLSEGKRILLFSQFTSMLDLIAPELKKRNIEYVEIRGDTKDRATPVRRFQKGEVPLFLLSLKAGGFGLNLTAADTVIHYDPWWNPAVENQATDRAHRIGQSQSVFVFKLIASDTIEERMLELQERKKAIAEAVFDDENSLPFKLTADDLESLFKPLKG